INENLKLIERNCVWKIRYNINKQVEGFFTSRSIEKSKDLMATEERTASNGLGFRVATGVAALVGLVGGLLFGVWDSVIVTIEHSSPPVAFGEIFSLALYSVALYGIIGCLVMAIIGLLGGTVIRVRRYKVNKSQLVGGFIGVFVLLSVYALLAYNIIHGSVIDIIEGTVIAILSGLGFGALIAYVLGKGMIRKEKLIAGCGSMLISLLVLLYGGLWVNLGLLPGRGPSSPASLLADTALLIIVIFLGAGLYVLFRLILHRCAPWKRQASYALMGAIVCAFIAVSFTGPFSSEDTLEAGAPVPDEMNAAAGGPGERPNILWIVMDTVRVDHLSCYGYHRDTTPNIDRIASEGMIFENAISAAPWTLPSHASMFTSMLPSKHGTDSEHRWLEDDFQTIAEVLRTHGYNTFGYSNNEFVSPQTNLNQGFNDFEMTCLGRLAAGSELADSLRAHLVWRELQNIFLMDDGARRTNETVKKWIGDARQSGTPFFGFINYMEAHLPYHPPPEDHAAPYLDTDVSFARAMGVNQEPHDYIAGQVDMDAMDFEMLRALYDGEISYLDFRMGQLFDYLKELGIMDDTVLIISSDHGENFGEHNLMEHQLYLYDTLLHVPLVIRYPEVFEAGSQVSKQVQLTDIFPTILDTVDIDHDSEEIQGYSLLEDRQEGNSLAIAGYAIPLVWLNKLEGASREFDISKYARWLKSIHAGDFKYIWASDGRDELYNIRQDPEELNNLIEDNREKASELLMLLKEWLISFEPYRPGTVQQVR
ncbi:MAG: sulfatase-like hydrolase/transferase, partial [Dehalococcoidia bacterium]